MMFNSPLLVSVGSGEDLKFVYFKSNLRRDNKKLNRSISLPEE